LSCRRRGCLVIHFSVISNAVRNLSLDDKEGFFRFATFLQNDTFTSYSTVSEAGIQIFQTAANTPDTGACPGHDPVFTGVKSFFLNAATFDFSMREKNSNSTSTTEQKKAGPRGPAFWMRMVVDGVIS